MKKYSINPILYLNFILYLCNIFAIVAQLVEHWLPKPRVAGSSPVYRSTGIKIIGYELWFC